MPTQPGRNPEFTFVTSAKYFCSRTPQLRCCLQNVTCYTPEGTFYALSIGQTSSFTGLNLTHSYNNRLQPLEFKAVSTGGSAIDVTYNFVFTTVPP